MKLLRKRAGSRLVRTRPIPRPTRNSATTVGLLIAKSVAKLSSLNHGRKRPSRTNCR